MNSIVNKNYSDNLCDAEDVFLDLVGIQKHTSFADLEKTLVKYNLVFKDGVQHQIASSKYPNIIIWQSSNKLLIDAFYELDDQHKLKLEPAHESVYVMDGLVPNMPVAKSARNYEEYHWYPVTFSANPKGTAVL